MISIDIRQLNRCDVFLALWFIYYLQGILYPEGGLISTGILAINLLVSMYYAVKVIDMPDKPIYFRGLTWLVIMFSIYGFWLVLTNGQTINYGMGRSVLSYNYIKVVYLSLLPIYPFYYFSIEGLLTEDRIKKWLLAFFVSCTLLYFRKQREVIDDLIKRGHDIEETTNNFGYMFISLLPSMFLFRKRMVWMLCGIAYVMAFVVMGMKRGAILIGVIAVLYILFQTLKNAKKEDRIKVIVFIAMAVVCIVFLAIHQMHTSEYAMQRIAETKEGNTSNRDLIYSFFWDYFIHKADIIHYLFGRGANGTMELLCYAHNDWLEIAVNQGILGIVIYTIYWWSFRKSCVDCTNSTMRHIMMLTYMIFLLKTFFSMSYEEMNYISTCVLGFALANSDMEEPLSEYEQD